jgi:hypothetical protein
LTSSAESSLYTRNWNACPAYQSAVDCLPYRTISPSSVAATGRTTTRPPEATVVIDAAQ